jgi:hypothetical protein
VNPTTISPLSPSVQFSTVTTTTNSTSRNKRKFGQKSFTDMGRTHQYKSMKVGKKAVLNIIPGLNPEVITRSSMELLLSGTDCSIENDKQRQIIITIIMFINAINNKGIYKRNLICYNLLRLKVCCCDRNALGKYLKRTIISKLWYSYF